MTLTLVDLIREFDCVSHGVLLEKLKMYGVGGIALATLGSYFTGRLQAVDVGGATSRVREVHYGFPRGLSLGLFSSSS